MTMKDSILIIEVDLQCEKCYKKIQKVLCKLQSKENIRKIDYENTKNTVTITGPFDTAKLSMKLRCKAYEVIKDIKIGKPPEEKKPEAKKPEEKKPEAKKPEEKKPEAKKPEEKKPEAKKPEEKKPEQKKPEEKKPEKKKPEEKKKPAEEKKPAKEKKGEEKAKATAAAAAPPPSTTVNLQFTMCGACYPWPCRCSDPAAYWGGHHPQQQLMMPQWPPCGGMAPAPAPPPLPAPVHHPHPPCGGPQKWAPCGGPSFCGGCGWCHGGGGMHGWAAAAAQPMCCPGPSLCRGCNGCKIVQETKFSYEEYPSNACAIM